MCGGQRAIPAFRNSRISRRRLVPDAIECVCGGIVGVIEEVPIPICVERCLD